MGDPDRAIRTGVGESLGNAVRVRAADIVSDRSRTNRNWPHQAFRARGSTPVRTRVETYEKYVSTFESFANDLGAPGMNCAKAFGVVKDHATDIASLVAFNGAHVALGHVRLADQLVCGQGRGRRRAVQG